MFTDRQRQVLIEIARASVTAQVMGEQVDPPLAIDLPTAAGAFVTLKRHGQLRGCLGTVECQRPLAEEVASCAASAAKSDPRFLPVQPLELAELDIEVSVLGPLERIDPRDPDVISIGRHGLVIEQDGRRGLLLPQVAVEWGWTRVQFLAQTCRKAGLRADAWQHGARVYRFDADVFGG